MTPAPHRRPRWPWWVAGAAAVLWLLIAIAELVTLFVATAIPAIILNTGIVILALAAPVAIIALVAVQLRETGGARAERSALLAETAWLTDHRLDEAGQLLAGLEARFAVLVDQSQGIGVSSRALDKAADAADAASRRFEAIMATATAQAETLRAVLNNADGDLQRQIGESETLLAALRSRASDACDQANAAGAAAAAQIESISGAATAAAAALAAPVAALHEASASAIAGNAAAAAATRDSVDTNAAALAASVTAASAALEKIGDAATARAAAHLSTLHAAATQLTGEIGHQAERYRVFIEQLERGFAALDARLVASVAAGKAGLDTVATGMVAARDAVVGLATPIETTRAALHAVEAQVGSVGTATESALAALATALPAAAPQITGMAAGLDALNASASRLAAPITAGVAAIDDAGTGLLAAQDGLDTAALRVRAALAEAHATIAEIETVAGGTALAAASQLVDVFGRVRDVARQSAGTMRTALADVVAEAEAALTAAGSASAETAFGAPVRAALADLETVNSRAADTAQAAAERITQRLLALTGTIASVESRLAEAEDAQGDRLRADIAARSAALLASMEAAAIDIGALLSSDVDEGAWGKWLGGERGLFVRRAVRLTSGDTARDIANHWQSDSSFRELATRFIGEYEALIARVLPDREGRSLALALLSSDAGKLYVALAQASGRLQAG